MLLQFLQHLCLVIFSPYLISGLDVPFEPDEALRPSNPNVVNYERSVSVSRSEENERIAPFIRIKDDSSDEDWNSPARDLEESKGTRSFRKLIVDSEISESNENVVPKNLKNLSIATRIFNDPSRNDEKSHPKNDIFRNNREKSMESQRIEKSLGKKGTTKYIGDNFDHLQDDHYDLPRENGSNENLIDGKDFHREQFVESEEDLDQAENPNLRAFEEDDELIVIPGLQNQDENDIEFLKKVNGNKTVAYNMSDFLENPQKSNENTTIFETSTVLMKPSSSENIENKKIRTKLRKGKKRSGKKRKRITSTEKLEKKLPENSPVSREKILTQHTQRGQIPLYNQVENPNLRTSEENDELIVIPGLHNQDGNDIELLKKDNGNKTIAYRISDLFENPQKSDEKTTVYETSTLSMNTSSSENIENKKTQSKTRTKRRKGKKRSGKKRKGITPSEKLKKKSTENSLVSKEKIFAQHTRRTQIPGAPVVYSEKTKSQMTEKTIKKYKGIDRKPTLRPMLRSIKTKPEMEYLHYDTTIRSRYARTTVMGSVNNNGQTRNINVNVILPHNALITKFETNVNGRTIAAVIRDRNGTMNLPKALANGENIGTMLVETRDCDAVALAVNVPRDSTLNYTVTYEYLLERNLGVYAVPITVHNNMWIQDLMVRWRIQEERNLTTLKTPLIHKTTALSSDFTDDPLVCIINEEPGMAEIVWQPTINEQQNISRELGELSKRGVVGVLELLYDVLHDQDPCGQVVRQGGYFAQFFAPPNQPPLTKHVVFILDVSDSMTGDPIKQLKTAMNYILDTLQPMDNFTLINFSDEVNIMNIYNRTKDTVYRGIGVGPEGRGEKSGKTEWPGNLETYEATPDNIKAAKEAVKMMKLRVFTNIYDALIMGFKSVKDMTALPPSQTGQPHPEPFIIFLTDGHASDGPSYEHDVILKMVEDQNHNTKATMFALGFGGEADMGLLRRFALATNGIEKHIYKDIDAADQLVMFFESIKAPVLKDVYFKYSSKQVITATLTEQSFPMIHRGKEVIIAGKLDRTYPEKSSLYVDVTALGRYAMIRCERTTEKSQKSTDDNIVIKYSNATAMRQFMVGMKANQAISAGTVERIWGFQTLSQLRDEVELDHFETHQDTRCDDFLKPIDRMLEICLRLNYAMPTVTNLVYNRTLIERVSISPENGEQPEETLTQSDPLAKYPWILKLRDKHGFAKLPITNQKKGRMYTYLSLGVNETPPPPRSCADAIDGSPGECRYLPECPDSRVLSTPQKFRRHFCRLGSYAGVCCSDSVPRTTRSKRYV